MAQMVFQDIVNKRGLSEMFSIDSKATSTEEIGNPPHRGTMKKLNEEGIPILPHTAKQITMSDYEKYDYIIGMDALNMRNLARILNGDPEGKLHKLPDFAGKDRDIADPWYTGDFDKTYEDVVEGCHALLKEILEKTEGVMKDKTHGNKYISVFEQFDRVTGFFSVKDGASDGFPYDRKDVFTEAGVENCIPVWPHQIHKPHIEIIKEKPDTPLMLEDTDGIITDLEGVLLTTVHADCLPVYLFDDKREAIGLVHAGWRGTAAGIAPKAVRMMIAELGCDSSDIHAYVGPGISRCCFETDRDVYEAFLKEWPFTDEFTDKNPNGKYHIELKGINKRQLEMEGLKAENIEISRHCTCCEPEMFCSYRREGGTYKRMGAGLALSPRS